MGRRWAAALGLVEAARAAARLRGFSERCDAVCDGLSCARYSEAVCAAASRDHGCDCLGCDCGAAAGFGDDGDVCGDVCAALTCEAYAPQTCDAVLFELGCACAGCDCRRRLDGHGWLNGTNATNATNVTTTHVHEDPWCADDEAWFHAGAPWKDCAWVFASPDHRCGAVGDDGSLASTKCLESCGCGGSLGDLVAYQVGTKGGCGDGGWVLFYNDGDDDVELAPGTALASGAATHVFSGGDVVPAGGFLKVPAACDAPFDVGDHVLLVDESGAVVEEAAGLARDTPGFPTVWARGADGGFAVDGYESSAIYGGFGACFADCGEDCGVFEAGECASTCSSDERDFLAYQCEHALSSDGPPDLACLEGCAAYDAETPPCGWFDADLACAATCAEDVLVFVADYCDEYSVDWVAIFGEADKTRRFPASATVSVVWASGKHDVYLMAGKDRWEACDFEGAEFLGDASGVPLEGTAGDVTYAACSVGSHCASGQKVAVAWTGPAAATVSATVVLAGVDAADFNADEEAKDAFRVAVAHTVASPDVCPDPQSDWETCVSEPVARDHDRRRRLLAGHDEARVDFSVTGLSEDPAALADGVVETLEASVADGVLEANLAQFCAEFNHWFGWS